MIRVVIADDQELIRESLKIVLSTHDDLEIAAVCSNGLEVMHTLENKDVDVVLMDIRMPQMDGVLCTRTIKERFPHVKVIILTTFDDDEFVFSALKYGASGYLLKGVSMSDLHKAIITVYQGGGMINPEIATKIFSMFSKINDTAVVIQVDKALEKEITRSEWKIIQQVSMGLSNREIAGKLFLSEGTVRNHLSSILSKLRLRDRTQLAIWAVQKGVTTRDYDKDA